MSKRVVEILLSVICLITLFPFFVLIGLLIKLESKGPIFYLCDRVGENMNLFKMYKFRTMIDTPFEAGGSLSPQQDPRVTSFGRFLRRTKLNELPQFINVLKGEMTLVGPRPEAPDLAARYSEKAKKIFSVKPGLIGLNDVVLMRNNVCGRNEEELYPVGVDIKEYYLKEILPKKVEVDLEYIKNRSLLLDFKIILLGFKEVLTGFVNKNHTQANQARLGLFFADSAICVVSYLLAFITQYSRGTALGPNLFSLSLFLFFLIGARICWNAYFGLYRALLKFFSYRDFYQILKAVIYGSLTVFFISFLIGWNTYPKEVFMIDSLFLILVFSIFRLCLRFHLKKEVRQSNRRGKVRVMIFGAGDAGYMVFRILSSESERNYRVVGFIDDASQKLGKTLNGLEILGNRYDIKVVAKLLEVDELLISIPEAHLDGVDEIAKICQEAGLKYRFFNLGRERERTQYYSSHHKSLDLSRILRLPEIKMDLMDVKQIMFNKTVLVNGSGGGLGLELCQHILRLGCRQLIILDRYESYLTELVSSLYNDFPKDLILPVVFDGDDTKILEKTFENYRPNIVIHTCTKKYIPHYSLESDNVGLVNYSRTFQIARTSAKYGSEFFTMVSSLDADNGGHYITETLRITELSLKHFFEGTSTRLVIGRICNIAENRGGILSMIENQIENKEAIELLYADEQVYIISGNSAANFILQTLVEASRRKTGEVVFVCDPGKPIALIEVVKRVADFYGLEFDVSPSIKYRYPVKESIGLVQKRPVRHGNTYHDNIKVLQEDYDLHRENVQEILKKFVLKQNGQLSAEDWKRKTGELLDLCGPGIFMDRKEGDSMGRTACFRSR